MNCPVCNANKYNVLSNAKHVNDMIIFSCECKKCNVTWENSWYIKDFKDYTNWNYMVDFWFRE